MSEVNPSPVFVLATPSNWIVMFAMATTLVLDYAAIQALVGSGGVFHFFALATTTLVGLSAMLRTRAWVTRNVLLVRPYGFVGKESRYVLSEMKDVQSGTLNGEFVLQFTYRGQTVRLGPWWGFRRASLSRRVKELETMLSQLSEATPPQGRRTSDTLGETS